MPTAKASSAYSAPIPATAWTSHRALKFWSTYVADFGQNFTTTPPENYYSSQCIMRLVDGRELVGAAKIWEFFGTLYARFPRVEREILSLVVLDFEDGDGRERFEIRLELVTKLFIRQAGGEGDVLDVPQSFVYVAGSAEEGKGTDGLQFVELRNYYDFGIVERAWKLLEEK